MDEPFNRSGHGVRARASYLDLGPPPPVHEQRRLLDELEVALRIRRLDREVAALEKEIAVEQQHDALRARGRLR